jgi:prophage antirepressor-like protein
MSGMFRFEDRTPIRTEVVDGEPWFCLVDVARALNLSSSRIRSFPSSAWCAKDGVHQMDTISIYGARAKSQRKQLVNFINERNLYALIARSDRPEALRFMDWVYRDVLPSIRKTGGYATPSAPEPDRLEQFMLQTTEAISRLAAVVSELAQSQLQQRVAPQALPAVLPRRSSSISAAARRAKQATDLVYPVLWNAVYNMLDKEEPALQGFLSDAAEVGMRPIEIIKSMGLQGALISAFDRVAEDPSSLAPYV